MIIANEIFNYIVSNHSQLKIDPNNFKSLLIPYDDALKFMNNESIVSQINTVNFDLLYKEKNSLEYISSKGINFDSTNAKISSYEKLLYSGNYIEQFANISKNNIYVEFMFNLDEKNSLEYSKLLDLIPNDINLTTLEKLLIKRVLGITNSLTWVYERSFTNNSYLVKLVKVDDLKIPKNNKTYIDKTLGAKLNGNIEVGFFIHVEDGYLRKVEGYTFYEDCPEKIESVEFFEIE